MANDFAQVSPRRYLSYCVGVALLIVVSICIWWGRSDERNAASGDAEIEPPISIVPELVQSPLSDEMLTGWSDPSLTLDECDLLVDASKKAPLDQVGPIILPYITNPLSIFSYVAPADPVWHSSTLKGNNRKTPMAGVVWTHHAAQSPRKAENLLRQWLLDLKSPDRRVYVIHLLQSLDWGQLAAADLRQIVDDSEEPLLLRTCAFNAFLQRCDAYATFNAARRIVTTQKAGERCLAFAYINWHDLIRQGDAEQTKQIIKLGFELLEQIPNGEEFRGHGIAGRLGSWLDPKVDFCPDRRLEKYHSKYGLNRQFEIDTVIAARAWYADHILMFAD